MKITLWTLASDDYNGTSSEIFLSEREAYLAKFDRITDDPKDTAKLVRLWDAAEALRDSSAKPAEIDKAEQALEDATERLRDFMDTYQVDSQTIDIPVKVCVEVSGGVAQNVSSDHEGIVAEIVDWDNLRDRDGLEKEQLEEAESRIKAEYPHQTL